MPTGYTAGILNGKVKTFPEFAKLCMKAFGACIHMRDYYKNELEKSQKELEEAILMSDSKIIKSREKSLKKHRIYLEKRVSEISTNKNKLESFLKEAYSYNPPSTDHNGVKRFMIEQLQMTIDGDGDTSYYERELAEVDDQLNNIDPAKIRAEMIQTAYEEIERYTKHYQEEVQRCESNNKWVTDFLNSIKK